MTTLAFFIGGVVLLCLVVSSLDGWITEPVPPTPPPKDHGNALGISHWATPEDMTKHDLVEDATSGIFVGVHWEERITEIRRWFRKPVIKTEWIAHRLYYVKKNVCALLVAVKGAGKFTSCLAVTGLQNSEDHIISVDQGQFPAVCGGSSDPKAIGWRRRLGRFVVLDAYDLAEGTLLPSSWVNPLHIVRLGTKKVAEIAGALASCIVPTASADASPHFRNSARSLVQALILYLVWKFGRDATLSQIPEILHRSEIELNKVFFEMVQQEDIALVRYVGRRFYRAPIEKTLPDKTVMSGLPPWTNEGHGVLVSAMTDTLFLSSPVAVNAFGGPGGPTTTPFSFDELKAVPAPGEPFRPITVSIVTPGGDAVTENDAKILELLLTTALTSIKRRPKWPPVLLLIDEFCNSTRRHSACVDLVKKLFVEGRKYGVRALIVAQSWGQLIEHLPGGEHDANTMFGNSGVRIFYGSEDDTTDSFIMKRNGNKTIWGPARGKQVDVNAKPGDESFEEAGESARAVPLIEVQDIRALLPNGQLIAYLEGLGFPVWLNRGPYHDKGVMPEIAARADDDPFEERKR